MTIHTDGTQFGASELTTGPTHRRSLSRAEIDRALGSDRRREIVCAVRDADGPVAIRTLVASIADAEHDPTAVTTLLERRQRVYISLCRTHLPLLESYDIITYDRDRGCVAAGRTLQPVGAILDTGSQQSYFY